MYYTCKKDKAFKYMFLDKEGIPILKELLEFILGEDIDSIELLPTELTEDNLRTKGKRLDALLRIKNRIIGLEMNSSDKNGYRVKNMSYMCNNYASIIEEGKIYNEDIELLQINFTYGLKDKKGKREYYVQDEEQVRFVNNFKIIEINMDYYMKMWYSKNTEEIKKNKYLIMLDLEEQDLKSLSKDRVVKEYMERLNKLNENIKFKKLFTDEEEQEMFINTAREEGVKEGLSIGKVEVAKNLIKDNVSLDDISKYTGLSIEEIEKLRNTK